MLAGLASPSEGWRCELTTTSWPLFQALILSTAPSQSRMVTHPSSDLAQPCLTPTLRQQLRLTATPTHLLNFGSDTPYDSEVTAIRNFENFYKLIWWQPCVIDGTVCPPAHFPYNSIESADASTANNSSTIDTPQPIPLIKNKRLQARYVGTSCHCIDHIKILLSLA